ncbi:acetylxylan esterase [Pelagicoccus sp. SDUM812003]|uniref:acetylxylan esterase n=1 Tax=Pelagicoccus sp. SDUM812003 TaxID=3041267 RepID=UPI00280FB43B|nr:acetylxylan esterase [Pelagicoccus sp. SDUM812003]MDQ8203224.1 alpha/beta fold hydrolase [Pelagicoccus sp. SDUM812003]
MPILDKPLSELKAYQGTNPRPADFDAYWSEALAELEAVDPEVRLEPCSALNSRNVELFHLSFTGVGGARVYAKFLRPKGAERAPALLMFHGYSANSGDWSEKLGYVNEGFCVASMDCRGQGGRSEDVGGVRGTTLRGHIIRGLEADDPQQLLYRSIFLDTAQLARIVMAMPEVDPARVASTGGSQGGALSLACAALEPQIALCSAAFPFLCDYKRVWEMDLAAKAYEELSYYLRRRDPLHQRVDAMFEKLGYIDIQNLVPRIKAPVLMATGLMDDICPPSTQFAAYNKIVSEKEMALYPDFGHEDLPGFSDSVFNFNMRLR